MPVEEDGLFAVGVAPTFAHAENSETLAIEQGVENLTLCLYTWIHGEAIVARSGGGELFSGRDVAEETSEPLRRWVTDHYQIVAKHISPDSTCILLRLGEPTAASVVTSPPVLALEPPSWLTNLPSDDRYIYARGHSNAYFREENSWKRAEQNARIALALSLETKVHQLTKRLNRDMEMAAMNRVDIRLNWSQVVSRWKHPEDQTCHVLIRMPIHAREKSIEEIIKSVGSDAENDSQGAILRELKGLSHGLSPRE